MTINLSPSGSKNLDADPIFYTDLNLCSLNLLNRMLNARFVANLIFTSSLCCGVGKGKPNQTLVVNISLACLVLFLAILVTVLVFLLCKKRPVITRMHSGRNHALNFGNGNNQKLITC